MKPIPEQIGAHHPDLNAVITGAIRSVSAKAREVPVTPGSLLLEDLALDSLDLVAVILQIQDYFHVEFDPDEIQDLRCVDDLVASLTNHLRAAA